MKNAATVTLSFVVFDAINDQPSTKRFHKNQDLCFLLFINKYCFMFDVLPVSTATRPAACQSCRTRLAAAAVLSAELSNIQLMRLRHIVANRITKGSSDWFVSHLVQTIDVCFHQRHYKQAPPQTFSPLCVCVSVYDRHSAKGCLSGISRSG